MRAAYADPGGSLQYAIRILEKGPGNDADSQDSLAPQAGPEISIFYGTTQSFGQLGHPQRQINILGNAADPDGIKSLTYILNGGQQKTLSLGPDTRRLLKPGDFNVELYDGELDQGANTLVITATDIKDEISSITVTINYDRTHTWPLPYQTNWASGIQSQGQVVDGKWEVQGGGLHIVEVGYDRLVAIGDINWKDYEVMVPITIHSVDPTGTGYLDPSFGPALGLIMRWTGHTDDPVLNIQPKEGWLPLGAMAWWRWRVDWGASPRLQIHGNDVTTILAEGTGKVPTIGETYFFKMRVETTVNGPEYRLKVWQQGDVEPANWDLSATGLTSDPARGSIVLLAHHIDATFGDVHVVPLGQYQNFLPAIFH